MGKCGYQLNPVEDIGDIGSYCQMDDAGVPLKLVPPASKDLTPWWSVASGSSSARGGDDVTKDGVFPVELLPQYIDCFEMTEDESWAVIESSAKTKVLERLD